LFKEFALDNNQKLKVVETFDRTQSTREIKLVYSTLAEQFGDNGSIKNKKSIFESASAKSGSTKPSKQSRKVIGEEAQVANRFKKLAGIING
jgi:predicted HNH restriction endonuclease